MKALVFVLALCSLAFFAKAQSKWEVRAGYGLASAQEIVDGLADMTTSLGSLGTARSSTDLSYGPILVGVNYFPMPKLSVGLQYSNTKMNNDITLESGGMSNYENLYHVIMARSDYYYSTGFVQVYSGLGAGVSFSKSSPTKQTTGSESKSTDFAYQVNAIGARVGRTIGVFGELGFGYNGVLNLGISAKF